MPCADVKTWENTFKSESYRTPTATNRVSTHSIPLNSSLRVLRSAGPTAAVAGSAHQSVGIAVVVVARTHRDEIAIAIGNAPEFLDGVRGRFENRAQEFPVADE